MISVRRRNSETTSTRGSPEVLARESSDRERTTRTTVRFEWFER